MKRIFAISVSVILGITVLVLCCQLYRYRTRTVTQEYTWHDGIGIRVEEYRFYKKSDYYCAEGVVNIKNASNGDIQGNPLFRVIVRDAEGVIHSMQRQEDAMDLAWSPFTITVDSSFKGEFDGVLKFENKPSEFAVRWEGNTNIVTDWIAL